MTRLINPIRSAIKLTLASTLLFIGCNSHDEHVHHHSIKDKIEHNTVHPDSVDMSSHKYISDIKTLQLFLDNHSFSIPTRKDKIQSFECSECHSKPLSELQKKSMFDKKAHWDVKLNHASEETMNCITCHSETNMDSLHTLTGQEVDFDFSFKLCGQCHSVQFDDWKGGAHGKQVGGWANPRVSKTCVNCHDPHSPSFEPRWPARYNTEKVKERK